MPTTNAIIQYVSQTKEAIGYVGLAYAPASKRSPYLLTEATMPRPQWRTTPARPASSSVRSTTITM